MEESSASAGKRQVKSIVPLQQNLALTFRCVPFRLCKDAMVEAGLPFRMGYVAAARAAQLKIGTIFGDPSKALLPSKTLILHGTLDRWVSSEARDNPERRWSRN